MPRRCVRPADEDQRRRQQGHELPAGEERQRVARAEHLRQREREGPGQHAERTAPQIVLEVARGEQERGRPDGAERAEEKGSEPVDAEAGLEGTREGAAGGRPRGEHPEPGEPEQPGPGGLGVERGPERRAAGGADGTEGEKPDGGEQQRRRHSDSSSWSSDCWSARRRVISSRPVASRSKTRVSSTE